MATPAKAFIDPVWPSSAGRMMIPSDITLGSGPIPFAWERLGAPLMTEPRKQFTVLVAMSGVRTSYEPPTVTVRIPTPPMGRMQINTFPPIYKERPNEENSLVTGQVYPPKAP